MTRIGEGRVEGEPRRPIYGRNLVSEYGKSTPPSASGILSKEDILKGKDVRKNVRLDQYSKDVIIRPLTDGELSTVFEVIGNIPLNEHGLPDLNLVNIGANLKALRMITSMALVEPSMTEEEVALMPFGVPGFLAKEILELSGLSPTAGDEIKKFRDQSARS